MAGCFGSSVPAIAVNMDTKAMTSIPNSPDQLLTRTELAAALTELGFPTSPATLATRATRGGGPLFRKNGVH